jgi:hypothetical protein
MPFAVDSKCEIGENTVLNYHFRDNAIFYYLRTTKKRKKFLKMEKNEEKIHPRNPFHFFQFKPKISSQMLELYNGEKVHLIEGSRGKFRSDSFTVQREFNRRSLAKSWCTALADVFLPKGYPTSVTKDYAEYQVWDTIQACASSLSAALSTAAILKGAGVGDEVSF